MTTETKKATPSKAVAAAAEAGVSEKNQKVFEAVAKQLAALHQGDKLFLRNQLGMSVEEAKTEFWQTMALWKKRGGGMTEWEFVLHMTDEEILRELGFEDEEDESESE